MNHGVTEITEDFGPGDGDILVFDVSDAELEAAAGTTPPLAAMSFPNAPTVSVLVYCCGNDASE
jgi:hypothetical protein